MFLRDKKTLSIAPLRAVQGVTLMELLIVIALVAIIAAVGYPSYSKYQVKSRRAECQQIMMNVAAWMEGEYARTFSYPRALDAMRSRCPATGSLTYNMSVTFGSSDPTNPLYNNYTLIAQPTGGQRGDPCGEQRLTIAGEKWAAGVLTTSSSTAAACWK